MIVRYRCGVVLSFNWNWSLVSLDWASIAGQIDCARRDHNDRRKRDRAFGVQSPRKSPQSFISLRFRRRSLV